MFVKLNTRPRSLLFAVIALAIVIGLSFSPFTNASCSTSQSTNDATTDLLARLRALAHTEPLPAESVVQSLETGQRGSTTAALARLLRARIKAERGNDYAGAAALLDDADFKSRTAIADYALFTRAAMLDKAGRKTEARAAYEQLARDYPASLRAPAATLRAAEILMADANGGARGVTLFLRELTAKDDAAALLLHAKAAEASGERDDAVTRLRRIIFYAPATPEAVAARASLTRLNASLAPVNADEATTRAERLYAARRFADATDAYADAFRRFPALATPQAQLKRGTAAVNARRIPDAASALRSIPLSAADTHAEALATLAVGYARARQFTDAQTTLDELRRIHPRHKQTRDALVRAGEAARDAKNSFYAQNFFRAAVTGFPGAAEVAGAQFELAWAAHERADFAESARLLTEHLAAYADRNTDNRGRAGYWAARDAERAGKTLDAQILYEAMQARYDANWYGYLAKQRRDEMVRAGRAVKYELDGNSTIGRAAANLQGVTVGENTLTASDDEQALLRAVQLGAVGFDDYAFEEFNALSAKHPTDARVNLAFAQLHRARTENVQALTVLRRTYPDYSQMKPAEMTAEEWDVFYPLTHWNIIRREAQAKNLDPYTVAGTYSPGIRLQPARRLTRQRLRLDATAHPDRARGGESLQRQPHNHHDRAL
jgi:TolA-binding protein